jgi:succinate dehydrogenase/fumarate reductase flavoprotein subunit
MLSLLEQGLAGGSAAATLAELGYNVKAFFPRSLSSRTLRAQGGINAAKKIIKEIETLDCFTIL